MFTWTWIFRIVLFGALADSGRVLAVHLKYYTCEEFEQDAYFDPYELIDSLWKIFYFWGDNTEIYPIRFSLPTKQKLQNFKEVVDAIDSELQVEWHKATLMMEPRPGLQILLLYAGTTGAFRAVIKIEHRKSDCTPNNLRRNIKIPNTCDLVSKCHFHLLTYRALIKNERRNKVRPRPMPLLKFADVRMKMVGRFLGMMCCEDNTAFALARMQEMPLTELQCKNGAATLGFVGSDGRSHLYVQRLTTEKTHEEL